MNDSKMCFIPCSLKENPQQSKKIQLFSPSTIQQIPYFHSWVKFDRFLALKIKTMLIRLLCSFQEWWHWSESSLLHLASIALEPCSRASLLFRRCFCCIIGSEGLLNETVKYWMYSIKPILDSHGHKYILRRIPRHSLIFGCVACELSCEQLPPFPTKNKLFCFTNLSCSQFSERSEKQTIQKYKTTLIVFFLTSSVDWTNHEDLLPYLECRFDGILFPSFCDGGYILRLWRWRRLQGKRTCLSSETFFVCFVSSFLVIGLSIVFTFFCYVYFLPSSRSLIVPPTHWFLVVLLGK